MPPDPTTADAGDRRLTARRRLHEVRTALRLRADPTYRRLASGYRLPDGSRRIYCHHVRKTAGTSLYTAFLGLGGEDPMDVWRRIAADRLSRTVSGPYVFAANDRQVLAEGAWFFGRSHRPAERQPLPPGTFTVTILRDPVARVHSYVDYLVAGDDESTPGKVGADERRLADGGMDAFLGRAPAPALLTQLHTFSTRLDVDEAVDRVRSCSAVLVTESYPEGVATLGGRLGLPLAVQRSRVTPDRSQLTGAQEERLRRLLAPEYEFLRRLAEEGIVPAGYAGG